MKISIIKSKLKNDIEFLTLVTQNKNVIFFNTRDENEYYFLGEEKIKLKHFKNKKPLLIKTMTYELQKLKGVFTTKLEDDVIVILVNRNMKVITETNYLGFFSKYRIRINKFFQYKEEIKPYLGQIHELIYNSGKL